MNKYYAIFKRDNNKLFKACIAENYVIYLQEKNNKRVSLFAVTDVRLSIRKL